MTSAPLARRLTLGDAVTLGLGSMLGAGVFAALAPAAGLAGRWLLVALGIAALVATANALSTAQLAAQHPVAGGAYAYGRARLGPWWGFVAGWGFVVGKTASCAAMALTLGAYAWPGHERVVALVALALLVAIDVAGVTRTARATRALLVVTLLALGTLVVVVAVAAATGTLAVPDILGSASTAGAGTPDGAVASAGTTLDLQAAPDLTGVLGAAGLLFFALAGYARVATLGEEVRDPARTIPRAVVIALVGAVAVVALVAAAALAALGTADLAASVAPLADAARAAGAPWLVPVVGVAAVTASGGAFLALLAGVGRTTFAMAREGDLPRSLARVGARWRTPTTATLLVGAAVAVLVWTTDLRGALGASSAGVLLYYGVANAAAWKQPRGERIVPRWVPALGLVGCLTLVATLPRDALAVAGAVLVAGVVGRALAQGVGRRGETRGVAGDVPL